MTMAGDQAALKCMRTATDEMTMQMLEHGIRTVA